MSSYANSYNASQQEQKAQQALERLGSLPGMKAIKDQVEQMIQLAKISKLRKRQGLKTKAQSNHMIFTGNPGTGKTTAARLIGEAFSALKLIKTKQGESPFIEVHHADVMSKYVGDAEKKIKEKFKEASGGVLFFDEAYAFLAGDSEHQTESKVIATIVQLMEDMRDEIIVIAAGYPKNMEELLDSNPGLRSRFPNTIRFPDYDVPDLIRIVQVMCVELEYWLSNEFIDLLARRLWVEKMKPVFGNARTVRNILEQSIRIQSVRLSKVASPDRNTLMLLTGADVDTSRTADVSEKDMLLRAMQEINERLLEIDLREILYKSDYVKN